ncbi:MAG: PilZ domain-containing protein [Phycisphaerales bacterium]|nr:PilZ domain-containing protein [Phycisphaerales bacterium]
MGTQEEHNSGFDDWAHDLLKELEQQTPEAIRRMRSSERHEVQSAVKVRPANASDFGQATVEGLTGDVSPGGCRVMTSVPLRVGDVYRLEIEKGELDLPILFARCLRCRLVREDAFESGFAFFNTIKLDEARSAGSIMDSLL